MNCTHLWIVGRVPELDAVAAQKKKYFNSQLLRKEKKIEHFFSPFYILFADFYLWVLGFFHTPLDRGQSTTA